jgi:hypothetical protein
MMLVLVDGHALHRLGQQPDMLAPPWLSAPMSKFSSMLRICSISMPLAGGGLVEMRWPR